MTTENKKATSEESPSNSGESVNSSGKDAVADSKLAPSGADVRDDQDRRTVIWAGILLILSAAPLFLPTERDRSLWYMTRHDSTGRAIVLLMFGGPVFLGIMGLWRGLRRNIPKKALLVFSSILTCLFNLAAVALMSMLLIYERRAAESPLIWLGALASLLGTFMFVRSFFRQNWQRYQHLLAAFAFLAMMIILAIAGSEPNALNRMGQGAWFFFFVAAALAPFAGSTLFSRRSV